MQGSGVSEIVNLRSARKRKARDDKRKAADANAAKHGRTKGEKRAEAAEKARAEKALDGAKQEP